LGFYWFLVERQELLDAVWGWNAMPVTRTVEGLPVRKRWPAGRTWLGV
jgi:hypothetical protein